MVRILSALVLAVFLGQSTLAFAFPCSGADSSTCCPDGEEDEQDHEPSHDQKRCPCPISCAPGCAGSALRAVPSAPLVLVLPSPLAVEILWFRAERAPPPIEPADIAHVPRPRA